MTRLSRRRSGFTLLEILVAAAIFATVMAMVYGIFSGIEGGIAKAQEHEERIRMTDFLLRELSHNLASVYVYQNAGMMEAAGNVAFLGEDRQENGFDADSLGFVSLAPPLGGGVAPGGPKRVMISLDIPPEQAFGDMMFGDEERQPTYLNLREEQLLSSGLVTDEQRELTGGEESDEFDELFDETRRGIKWTEDQDESGMGSEIIDSTSVFDTEPVWSVEVRSFNLRYFDGTDWVDGWDSSQMQAGQTVQTGLVPLLPWAVRVEIDFPSDDDEEYSYADELSRDEDDHDFITVLTLPVGYGLWPDEAQLFAPQGLDVTTGPTRAPKARGS